MAMREEALPSHIKELDMKVFEHAAMAAAATATQMLVVATLILG